MENTPQVAGINAADKSQTMIAAIRSLEEAVDSLERLFDRITQSDTSAKVSLDQPPAPSINNVREIMENGPHIINGHRDRVMELAGMIQQEIF